MPDKASATANQKAERPSGPRALYDVLYRSAKQDPQRRFHAIYDKVVAKYGFMTKLTRFLAKVGGLVKRKNQPYADRGVVVTLAE